MNDHWTNTSAFPSATTSLGRQYIEEAAKYRDECYKTCKDNVSLAYIDGNQYGTKVLFILGGTREQRIEKLVSRCIADHKFDGYEPEDFGCYPRKKDIKCDTIEEHRALSFRVAYHAMYGRGKPYGYNIYLDSDSVDWGDAKSYGDFLTRMFTRDISSMNTDLSKPYESYFYVSEQTQNDWYKHFDYIKGTKEIQIEFLHVVN